MDGKRDALLEAGAVVDPELHIKGKADLSHQHEVRIDEYIRIIIVIGVYICVHL